MISKNEHYIPGNFFLRLQIFWVKWLAEKGHSGASNYLQAGNLLRKKHT
jgi:hypothetical protein